MARHFCAHLLSPRSISLWGMFNVPVKVIYFEMNDCGLVDNHWISVFRIEGQTVVSRTPVYSYLAIEERRTANDERTLKNAGFDIDWDSLEFLRDDIPVAPRHNSKWFNPISWIHQ